MILGIYVSHMSSTKDSETLPEPFPTTADEVESADWGDRNPEILETFDDGGFVVKFGRAGGRYSPLDSYYYYVPPEEMIPEGDENMPWQDWYGISGSYRRNERQRRAIIIGRLNARTGFFSEGSGLSDNVVPISVAVDGQKAIAAYLFAMKQWNTQDIADKMEKSQNTVRQYLSDYKAGRTG